MGDTKDALGKWLTLAMFWESRHPKYTPTYTLKDYDMERDGIFYPSLKKIYLEKSDPTEYLFATEVFDSWPHWQAICNSYRIRPIIAKWREELEVKLRAEGIRSVINHAQTEKGYQAAKWLADKGWEKKRKAGAPSKVERKNIEQKIIARICKRASVKAGQILSPEESKQLLLDLEACLSPRTCPHGRPTMIHLSVDLLERKFGRTGPR